MPFRDVIGHRSVVSLLQQAVDRRRVPQSLILAGPEGIGKRTIALALAQAVNCPKQEDGDACGACIVCSRILRGSFSDVVYVDKGGEASIKIGALRTRVLDPVGYRPFEGMRRVFIIDPADEMTDQAQDAMLKTLEEPPPSAILILISAYPDVLSATIRSRCRRVRFGVLSESDVTRVLIERAKLTPKAAAARASVAGGSVARALAIEEGEFEEDRAAAFGLLSAATRGMPASTEGRLKAATAFAKHPARRRARETASSRLAILSSLLRDVGAIGTGGEIELANADLVDDLRRLASAFPIERVTQAWGVVEQADAALARNASPKIVADWLAVSI